MTDIRHYAYISTGKLSAMFTLWRGRECFGGHVANPDYYVCNLAAADNEAEAERKAIDFCERMSERMGVTVHFYGFEDMAFRKARKGMTARQQMQIERIEAGVFPFGKHEGKPIADAPEGYLLFWADKHADADPVTAALAAACMGVAMEKGFIAKRDAERAARIEADAKSQHVGEIGDRLVIEGEVLTAYFRDNGCGYADQPEGYWINKVRTTGGDLIVYFGNKLAERGQRVRFRATVKAHAERDGVKSTKVNRPAKLEILTA